MGDLEAEHDILMERERAESAAGTQPVILLLILSIMIINITIMPLQLVSTPAMCLERPDPGPCTDNIVRWSASSLYVLV